MILTFNSTNKRPRVPMAYLEDTRSAVHQGARRDRRLLCDVRLSQVVRAR
jgi:hypothetical protein